MSDLRICEVFGWDLDEEINRDSVTPIYMLPDEDTDCTYPRNTSARVRSEVLARSNGRCFYCGNAPDRNGPFFEVDHVQPRSKGGSTDLANLVASCHRCNRVKAGNSVERFRAIMGGGLFWGEIVEDVAS